MDQSGHSRRAFLRLAGGGVVLSSALLAACGAPAAAPTPAPAAPPKAPGAPPAATLSGAPAGAPAATPGGARSVRATNPLFPTFIPTQDGPKPDFPALGPLYEDGFINYPAAPSKALPAEPPGTGGRVTSFNIGLYPPPNPLDQNPAWQAVNKALNANVEFNIVANPGDYPAKLGTLMAGGDLPDLMYMNRGLNAAPNLPLFLRNQCADLTPFLSGDAAKEYPYLAAIPTFAWQNSGCAATGMLQMLPIQRYAPGVALFKNETLWDREIGKDVVPKSADDYKRMLQSVNRPQEGRWATASYTSSANSSITGNAFDIDFYAAMFGAPNTWGFAPDGKLIRSFETEEYKAAVGYVRDLFAAGLFHPNTLTYNINSARVDFIGSKWVAYPSGFGNPWNDFWRRGLAMNPPVNFHLVPPFAASEGDKPQHYFNVGYQGTTALKKASPERIKELLRIMNWLAAPFGSAEDLLLKFGIKDIDYTLDDNNNPILTDRGNADANYVPWKYVVQHPQVIFAPDIPNYAQTLHEAEKTLIPAGVEDPTLGYYAPTSSTKGVTINQAFTDGITEIMAGRQPLSAYDQLVKDWLANGGEQIRKEYMEAIAAATR
jgi:putative aldouronate transport system substrate-binding protein